MFLTLFLLEFICAISFVFALFLWVCYGDYISWIMVWGLFFFALGWERITVSGYRVSSESGWDAKRESGHETTRGHAFSYTPAENGKLH